MNIKMRVYYKNNGVTLPKKSNLSDAGYDVYASTSPNVVGEKLGGEYYKRIDYIEYGTDLFVKPTIINELDNKVACELPLLDLRPRSSISKYNLLLCNAPATVDESYRGEIKVRFKYIFQPEDLTMINGGIVGLINWGKVYNKGDRIVQLLPNSVLSIDWQPVDKLDETERGSGGFGSTGN